MELVRVSKYRASKIYRERMKQDFPKSELKPFIMIARGMDAGTYEFFAMQENGETLGYTCLIHRSGNYLVDYLAIYPEKRNHGLGGKLISLLRGQLPEAKSIIGEVEDPDFANTEAEKNLQSRRLGFYLRNGWRDTGVRVTTFGVYYVLIETGEGLFHTFEETRDLYRMHYAAMLPENMIKKNMVI